MKAPHRAISTLVPLALSSLIAFTLLFTFTPPSSAQSWSGKCVGVSDGDTVKLIRDRESHLKLVATVSLTWNAGDLLALCSCC